MTPKEAVLLVRYVRAMCPAQKIDEYTPDAWFDLLAEYSLDECQAACRVVGRRQAFIAPAEIIGEINRVRRERLRNFRYEPGSGDESAEEYLQRLRLQIADVAEGRRPAALPSAAPDGSPIGEVLSGEVVRSLNKELES